MARPLKSSEGFTILSTDEMTTIEAVLAMSSGYVLDFTDRAFNEFVKRNWNVTATAPAYTKYGTSKANRVRGLLTAFDNGIRAEILQKLIDYRNHPSRRSSFEEISPELEDSYRAIIRRLGGKQVEIDSSSWTGRPSLEMRVVEIRAMAPRVLDGLADLINLIEERRFNDPETADALEHLKQLHTELGALIEAIDMQRPLTTIVDAIRRHSDKLGNAVQGGAKLLTVAPALTFGVSHMLAWMFETKPDTTLVGAIYAAIVGADALKGRWQEKAS